MTAKLNFVKSAALALGLGASLGLAAVSQATQYSLILGGSSALQGTFTVPVSFGGLPSALGQNPGLTVTNFRSAANTPVFFERADITVRGTNTSAAGVESDTALIAYTVVGANNYNIIVFVRSDSGQGVRYVANQDYILSYSNLTPVDYPSGTSRTASGDDANVNTFLNANVGPVAQIDGGLSDVTADSVLKFATGTTAPLISNINRGNLNGVVQNALAVQVLLLLNNSSINGGNQVNYTKDLFRSLVGGEPGSGAETGALTIGDLIGSGPDVSTTPIVAAYREATSGTRLTEFLDIQQGETENLFSFGQAGSPDSSTIGGTKTNTTGNMLTGVNTTANSTGYAFVTGTAGNGKGNIRVGLFNGVSPYGGSNTGTSLPNNNTTTAYGTGLYYPNVGNGIYEIWSQANLYVAKNASATEKATAADLANQLTNALNTGIVHQLGFVQVGGPTALTLPSGTTVTVPNVVQRPTANATDLQVRRTGFISGLTGEYVTDGQHIHFDTSNAPFVGGDIAIPNAGSGIIQ